MIPYKIRYLFVFYNLNLHSLLFSLIPLLLCIALPLLLESFQNLFSSLPVISSRLLNDSRLRPSRHHTLKAFRVRPHCEEVLGLVSVRELSPGLVNVSLLFVVDTLKPYDVLLVVGSGVSLPSTEMVELPFDMILELPLRRNRRRDPLDIFPCRVGTVYVKDGLL